MRQYNSTSIMGIAVHHMSPNEVLRETLAAVNGERTQLCFACANPHSLVVSRQDEAFRGALDNADLVVADGAGILLGARLLGVEPPPRITGHDYFTATMRALNKMPCARVCFMGSTETVLGKLRESVTRDYPNIEICATMSPPFRTFSADENASIVEKINIARPHILWVGMTAPKQEKWVYENRRLLDAPVIGSIGAVFDFIAGIHPRAPQRMCALHLEWLYRLIREPRRMWQRNFVSTPKYLAAIVYCRLSGKDRRHPGNGDNFRH